MENNPTTKETKFSDYVYIIYKWKKFLLINLLLVVLITSILVFLMPNQYRATATVMIPPENQMGLGGLGNLLGNKSSLAAAGSKLLGGSSTSEDLLLGIMNSHTTITAVINKYNLLDYYEIDDKNIDKAIKAFQGDFSAEPNEYGLIELSVINKNPYVCAEIANYIINIVDSLNIVFNIQQAKSNRIFIEKRYDQNIYDLKSAEDSLYKFQKRYGIVAVPEQLEVTVKAAAEIESQLTKKEMESYFILQGYGEDSPQYKGIQMEIKLLKDKVQEIKNSPNLRSSSNILFPFKEMPNIAIQYLRAYREVEIQQSILEIVMPMYEQAKVEEQKSIPTMLFVDKAIPPQLKYRPQRSFIIIGFFALSLFLLLPFVFRMEKITFNYKPYNAIEEFELKFYSRIQKLFRVLN